MLADHARCPWRFVSFQAHVPAGFLFPSQTHHHLNQKKTICPHERYRVHEYEQSLHFIPLFRILSAASPFAYICSTQFNLKFVSPYSFARPLLRTHSQPLLFHAILILPSYFVCSSPTPFKSSTSSLFVSPGSSIRAVTPRSSSFPPLLFSFISITPSSFLSIAAILLNEHVLATAVSSLSSSLTLNLSFNRLWRPLFASLIQYTPHSLDQTTQHLLTNPSTNITFQLDLVTQAHDQSKFAAHGL